MSSSILTVSMKDKVTGEVSVRAVCHRSMKKSEKPHDLRVEVIVRAMVRQADKLPVSLIKVTLSKQNRPVSYCYKLTHFHILSVSLRIQHDFSC